MSRTYRRRRWRQLFGDNDPLMDWYCWKEDIVWEDVDYIKYSWDFGYITEPRYNIKYNKKSKTGRKLLAVARSDAATHSHKEPGPHYFRNLYSDRPLRRKAKEELRKFTRSIGKVDWDHPYELDEFYEPMILAMEPLPYWT